MAGLGDSAAAKAIHREASPGLRLRSKAQGPPNPPSRDQNPLRLRVPPLSIPLSHTQKTASGVSSTHPQTPGEPLHAHSQALPCRLPAAPECPGHKTEHPRARTGRARALEVPCLQSSQLSLLPSPPPTPLPSYWPDREGGGSNPLPSPSLPIGQTVGRAPPSIGCGRGPLPAADSPLAEAGDRETLRGNGAGDPDPLRPPNSSF